LVSSEGTGNGEHGSWFIQTHNEYTSTFFFVVWLLHVLVFMAILYLVMAIMDSDQWIQFSYYTGVNDNCSQREYSLISYLIALLYFPLISLYLLILFFRHLKGLRDGLHLKREQLIVLVLWITIFIIWFLTGVMVPAIRSWIPLFGWTINFWSTVGIPLIDSIPKKRKKINPK